MPTDPNMTGLIYPTEGDSVDIWAMIMNSTCWPIIGAHDHTTGNGVKIPSAALKINADVSLAFSGTSYAVTDAKAIDFAAQTAASVASYAGALFVNSDDANNLYFRTVGGTNVKITDGTTLNVSIVGGIGGDYSSISALLDYDDATDTYRFRQETAAGVRQFAKIKSADLLLGEYKASGNPTVPTNFVTLKSPAALAAAYSVTFPAALPDSTSIAQVSSAGVMTLSNTIPTPTAPDYKYSTPQSLTFMMDGPRQSANGSVTTSGLLNYWTSSSPNWYWVGKCLPVREGDRITNIRAYWAIIASATVSVTLWKMDQGGTQSQAAQVLVNPTTGAGSYGDDITPVTVGADELFFLEVDGDASGDTVVSTGIKIDRP